VCSFGTKLAFAGIEVWIVRPDGTIKAGGSQNIFFYGHAVLDIPVFFIPKDVERVFCIAIGGPQFVGEEHEYLGCKKVVDLVIFWVASREVQSVLQIAVERVISKVNSR